MGKRIETLGQLLVLAGLCGGCTEDAAAALDAGGQAGGQAAVDPKQEALADRAALDPMEASVEAAAETEPMDIADGNAIWVHPTNPSRSTVIGANPIGGLSVFGLDGQLIQEVDYGLGGAAEVDVRYDIPLGDSRVSLVVGANNAVNTIRAFAVDVDTGRLQDVVAGELDTGNQAYGSCLYRSVDGTLYLFVTAMDGLITQHLLRDDGTGAITAQKVRELQIPPDGSPTVEACVADDQLGLLYVAQEDEARILRYGAEPDAQGEPVLVDDVSDAAGVNVEGLAIYHVGEEGGYLLASVQGQWRYRAYTRNPNHAAGKNGLLGSFEVVDGSAVDGATSHDCLEVTNVDLGGDFASGMLLVHDFANTAPGNEGMANYKLVPWEPIAKGLDLMVDTTWQPYPRQ